MNDNKQEILNQIEELKIKISELEAIVNKPEEVKQWEPKGKWFIDQDSNIHKGLGSDPNQRVFGNYFLTKESAEKAAIAMRKHNRLLAYVLEHVPYYEPDWKSAFEDKYYVVFKHKENQWGVIHTTYYEDFSGVYMPKEVATKLCEDLNSGRVTL